MWVSPSPDTAHLLNKSEYSFVLNSFHCPTGECEFLFLSLCTVEYMHNGGACFLIIILFSCSRWSYPCELRMKKELGTVTTLLVAIGLRVGIIKNCKKSAITSSLWWLETRSARLWRSSGNCTSTSSSTSKDFHQAAKVGWPSSLCYT